MMPGLCKAITILGTIILISSTTTPSLVLLYNSLRIILNGVRQVVAVVSNAFYPEFANLFCKKKFGVNLKKKSYFYLLK